MSKIMNWMMGEAEAGRFEFHEPPDYPDEAEYYGCGISWGQAREMLDNEPSAPEWTDEELNDFERHAGRTKKRTSFHLSWMKFLSEVLLEIQNLFTEGCGNNPQQG